MDAATHPGKGQLYLRMLLATSSYESSGKEVDEISTAIKLVYGLESDFASSQSSTSSIFPHLKSTRPASMLQRSSQSIGSSRMTLVR